MTSHFKAIFIFSVIFFLTSYQLNSYATENYQIGKDDILEISVWQSKDLSKSVQVDKDGNIDYPFLGKINVDGRSPYEVQKFIGEQLADGYIQNPKISVSVKEYNSKKILVFGEVENPGLYKLKGSIPLMELLFLVEGVKPEAKRLTVIRSQDKSNAPVPQAMKGSDANSQSSESAVEVDLISLLSRGDLSQNITIHPGDTVYVSSGTGQKFYVLGQVETPGPIEWIGEITVLEAIKLAGGPSPTAALNRIKVRQKRSGSVVELKVNVLHIMKGKASDDVVVQPGDTIIVPRSWI